MMTELFPYYYQTPLIFAACGGGVFAGVKPAIAVG